jgi:hypothetical protein
MSARKPVRRSLQPRIAGSSAAASAAALPVASAAVAPTPTAYPLDTRRLHSLSRAFEATIDAILTGTGDAGVSAPSVLLAALPRSVHSAHALAVQRLCEKTVSTVRRNILNEYEVILSEHRLPEKLGEIEYLEGMGGCVLEDGTTVGRGDAPTPAQTLAHIVRTAKQAELTRLQAMAEHIEETNAELQRQVQTASRALQSAATTVALQQQLSDDIYAAIVPQE